MRKGLWSYNPKTNPLPAEAGEVPIVICPTHGEQYAFKSEWQGFPEQGMITELECSICYFGWSDEYDKAFGNMPQGHGVNT